MKLKKGDYISNGQVERKILKVSKNGYLWCYSDIPEKIFDSQNSNDPLFYLGWKKVVN
ncbi:hypothetical protein P7H75_14075 [Vagococcus carniphilus]|uniref:hypothetical protein n=1 Tax=Vagococcus carniphilus TaxID=218144 RepID=UPI00288E6CFE|nr:hypothetical protein [Vagococcus carniphilus]MDT2815983.1 hypothetical protein [Vagococcus carniphilus]